MLIKLLKPLIRKALIKAIAENKLILPTLINKKLDIPKLSEDEEQKFFESQYELISEYVLTILDRL